MFVRKTYKIIDEVKGQPCQSCSHQRVFKTVEEKSWLMFIMIPLFPYKKRILWVCSVCGAGYEAKKASKEVKKEESSLKPDIFDLIKEKFDRGEISKNEYIRMNNIMKHQK
jgi:DNA-directed RNA polymerase subunit RPC12/RpoP